MVRAPHQSPCAASKAFQAESSITEIVKLCNTTVGTRKVDDTLVQIHMKNTEGDARGGNRNAKNKNISEHLVSYKHKSSLRYKPLPPLTNPHVSALSMFKNGGRARMKNLSAAVTKTSVSRKIRKKSNKSYNDMRLVSKRHLSQQ